MTIYVAMDSVFLYSMEVYIAYKGALATLGQLIIH